MKNKSWIQIIVFLFFIVAIPLGSYYYLKKGYDYRKEALQQMKNLGNLPEIDFTTVDGRVIVKDSLQGKMIIANAISLKEERLSDEFGQIMAKLYDQFVETNRLVMLSFGKDAQYDGQEALSEFAQKYGLDQKIRMYWIPADSSGTDQIMSKLYFPESELPGNPFFALCDTNQVVQNHYSIKNEEDIRAMVTHTAMFLPLKPRKRVEFRRETEK